MESFFDSILKAIGAVSPILFILSILIGIVSAKLINLKRDSELLAYTRLLENAHRINELKKRIKGLKLIAEELGVSEEDLEKFLILVKATKDMESVENNNGNKSVDALKNLSEYLTNKTPSDALMKELPK